MEIAIIYCRRSQDREWRQENTIESQLDNCIKIAETNNFKILEEIIESKSAKISWERPWFNRLLSLCKAWKIDHVIFDETDRISRDDWDSASFTTILNTKKIKSVFIWDKQIKNDDMFGQFMLWMQLWTAKLDNSIRSKKVREKMESCMKEWKILGKAPLGYKNVRITKTLKDVVVDEQEKEWGMEILRLVIKGDSYSDIWRKLFLLWLKTRWGKPYPSENIKRFVIHPFYIWFAKFQNKLYPHKYELIFPQSLLKQAREIVWVTRDYNPKIKPRELFPLKWILKTSEWKDFTAYQIKWIVYYRDAKNKINVSQDLIIESFWEYIKDYCIPKKLVDKFTKWIKDYYDEKIKSNLNIDKSIDRKMKELSVKKSRLLNLYYAWKINEELYWAEFNKFQIEEKEIQNELEELMKIDSTNLENAVFFIKLFRKPIVTREKSNLLQKIDIVKLIVIKLFLGKEKQLVLQENKLFEFVRIGNNKQWYSRKVLC